MGRICNTAIRVAALALLVWVFGCGSDEEHSSGGGGQLPTPASGTLALGSVSLTPVQEDATFQAFADYLASRLGAVDIGQVRVVVANSPGKMADHLRNGTVDFYFDSPFPVATVCDLSGARPCLLRCKQNAATYSSVIFARRDSGIVSPEDLTGRMLAFGAPFSTASFLVPKATLMVRGLKLERSEDPAAEVPPDRIGYVFSNDSENTMFWVLKKRVAAGAINADHFALLAGERAVELVKVLKTEEVPRNIVCHRGDLEDRLVKAVTELLLAMHSDEEGQKVLAKFEDTSRFERFSQGPEQALEAVRKLLPYVENDLAGQAAGRSSSSVR